MSADRGGYSAADAPVLPTAPTGGTGMSVAHDTAADMLPRLVERQRDVIEQQRKEIVRLAVENRELRKAISGITPPTTGIPRGYHVTT